VSWYAHLCLCGRFGTGGSDSPGRQRRGRGEMRARLSGQAKRSSRPPARPPPPAHPPGRGSTARVSVLLLINPKACRSATNHHHHHRHVHYARTHTHNGLPPHCLSPPNEVRLYLCLLLLPLRLAPPAPTAPPSLQHLPLPSRFSPSRNCLQVLHPGNGQ
jgi:hypothetical protein